MNEEPLKVGDIVRLQYGPESILNGAHARVERFTERGTPFLEVIDGPRKGDRGTAPREYCIPVRQVCINE